jgi:hypothetical protein
LAAAHLSVEEMMAVAVATAIGLEPLALVAMEPYRLKHRHLNRAGAI